MLSHWIWGIFAVAIFLRVFGIAFWKPPAPISGILGSFGAPCSHNLQILLVMLQKCKPFDTSEAKCLILGVLFLQYCGKLVVVLFFLRCSQDGVFV